MMHLSTLPLLTASVVVQEASSGQVLSRAKQEKTIAIHAMVVPLQGALQENVATAP